MSIEKQLEKEFRKAYEDAKKLNCRFGARFIQMLDKEGSVRTAKTLLATKQVPDGFIRLIELDRTDLSVEAIILKRKYRKEFRPEEIKTAKGRLGMA